MPETILKSTIDCKNEINNSKLKDEFEDDWSNDNNW